MKKHLATYYYPDNVKAEVYSLTSGYVTYIKNEVLDYFNEFPTWLEVQDAIEL